MGEDSNVSIAIAIVLPIFLLVITEIVATWRAKRKDIQQNTESTIQIKSDVRYIKEKIDELKGLPDRVIILEESLKSAHKRIDKNVQDIEKIQKG